MKPQTSISRRSVIAAVAASPFLPGPVSSQEAPLEWVVGYAAGGGSDIAVRLLTDHMAKVLGRPIIVNNRPGAATTIAAQYVAAAKTPMLLSADFATLAANLSLFSKLPYDSETDFLPVGLMARAPLILLGAPQVPASNFKEFLAWARSQPEGVNFASAGAGSPHHLVGELAKDLLGIKMNHIAYRGGSAALNDLAGGQVPMAVMDFGSAYQFVVGGRVKAFALTAEQRVRSLSDVPTLDELGYKGFSAYAWQGVVASKATPADLVARVNEALNSALNLPEVKARLQVFGVEGIPGPIDRLMPYARTERARWGEVIRKNHIRID